MRNQRWMAKTEARIITLLRSFGVALQERRDSSSLRSSDDRRLLEVSAADHLMSDPCTSPIPCPLCVAVATWMD